MLNSKRASLPLVPIAASIAWIVGAQDTTLESMLAERGLDGLESLGCYACTTCPKDPDGHHLEGSPDPLEIGRQHPDEEDFCHPSKRFDDSYFHWIKPGLFGKLDCYCGGFGPLPHDARAAC